MRAATGTLPDLTLKLNEAIEELAAPITPATGTLVSAVSKINALITWSALSLAAATGTLANAVTVYNVFVTAYGLVHSSPIPVVHLTTNGSGDGTGYSRVVSGKISQVRYVKTDFADGSTITMTAEATGETIWTESNVDASTTRTPRQATHGITGAAALYAALGVAVLDQIVIARDRIKVVVANGGDTKIGTFYITLE